MKINGKNAGVSVPVFSLRSKNGFGIGEFNDLKRLADWCYSTGLKIIQILPINDTISSLGLQDSYPYKSISVKALNPASSLVRVIDARTGNFMPDITEISLFSMQGKKILSLPNTSQFDVSSLPNAPYIVKISTSNTPPVYLKLLKQ